MIVHFKKPPKTNISKVLISKGAEK
jgi:hypothetical protein